MVSLFCPKLLGLLDRIDTFGSLFESLIVTLEYVIQVYEWEEISAGVERGLSPEISLR